jgi:lipid-A-disaccharide synthase-like uncharacterized protein
MLAAFSLDDFFNPLALFGFAAQAVFMMRFVVQWFVSEQRGRSHVPVAFWWLSLLGGLMLFVYATIREDVVFMAGQLLGVAIYVRNLMLIYQRQWRVRARRAQRNGAAAEAESEQADVPVLGELPMDEPASDEAELSARP